MISMISEISLTLHWKLFLLLQYRRTVSYLDWRLNQPSRCAMVHHHNTSLTCILLVSFLLFLMSCSNQFCLCPSQPTSSLYQHHPDWLQHLLVLPR